MEIKKVLLEEIIGSAYQPRTQKDLEIDSLVKSILENGLLQPVILRESKKEKYEIISGNRRIAALKIIQDAGHKELPDGSARIRKDGKIELEAAVLLSEVSDEDAAISAFVSNEERLNLQPLERARCYKHMLETLKISLRKLAKKINKSPAEISKFITFLNRLPEEILLAWNDYKITLKHVEIILRLPDNERQLKLYKMVTERKLSLPETEFYCARLLKDEEVATKDKHFDLLEEDVEKDIILKSWIDTERLRLTKSKIGEKITLNIKSRSELLDVLQLMIEALKKK